MTRTFVVFLLRGAFAELPPPRRQVALGRRWLWCLDRGGLRLPIAHARSVRVVLHARVPVAGAWVLEVKGSGQ